MVERPGRIYLDNASTSFPKPPCVVEAVCAYMTEQGTNVGRGDYSDAWDVEDALLDTRERVCALLGGPDAHDVVFTRNVTEALNLVLKGMLREGDHVVVSSMEHNAVMRPLSQLGQCGVTFSRAACAPDGTLDVAEVEKLLGPTTRAVVMTHASNVCGTILPVAEVGELCASRGVTFVVDAAQTAGVVGVDMAAWHADAVCFAGHKGLLGPQGTGGVVLSDALAHELEPLVAGGTGSASDREEMPDFMPDRLEAGTPNLPGLMGLRASLAWLVDRGVDAVCEHELALTGEFLDGLAELGARGLVRVVGLRGTSGRVGVVSIQTPGQDPALVAHELDVTYGIQTRVGLHCAPSAHRTLGTYPEGTIRFSFGWANTSADVAAALLALEKALMA